MITELKPNQVFVYGSNKRNFCGAGAASVAFCGSPKNDWRENELKQLAIYSPNLMNPKTGRLNKIGRWCVWGGTEQGFQRGYCGQSYSICTVENPGGKRVGFNYLEKQFGDLLVFAKQHPEFEFVFSKVGCGLAGFQEWEMARIVNKVVDIFGVSDNIKTLVSLYEY